MVTSVISNVMQFFEEPQTHEGVLESLMEGSVNGMIDNGIVFLVCLDDVAAGHKCVGQRGVCIFTLSVHILNDVLQWLLSRRDVEMY